MKRSSRKKSSPRSKPERKAKGSAKGAPKSAKARKTAAPKIESAPVEHEDPKEKGKPGDRRLPYGGFQLRLYDHDRQGAKAAVYDQQLRPVIFAGDDSSKTPAAATAGTSPGGPTSAGTATGTVAPVTTVVAADTTIIANLQSDLWALGFWVFPRATDGKGTVTPAVSGVFDWRTEWAVREFQVFARMSNVAVYTPAPRNEKLGPDDKKKESLLGKRLFRLSRKKNDHRVELEPNGVVTRETAKAIRLWLENNYVCPLVIQAMKVKDPKKDPTPVAAFAENIWCYDEVPNALYKMHAWDFSGYYSDDIIECAPLGDYQKYMRWTGPRSVPERKQCLVAAEVSPKSMLGKDWGDDLSKAEMSTFRVVAGVAEVECFGFLDAVNFYDNCLGSIGPCHWTGPKDTSKKNKKGKLIIGVGGGELCGFMAFLESQYPAVFSQCFSNLGVWGPIWGSPPGSQKERQGRRYCGAGNTPGGFVYVKAADYLKGSDKKFTQVPDTKVLYRSFEESTWLKSWTWAYRLQAAARTIPGFREAMWKYAVRRIERIRQISDVGDWVPQIKQADGTTRKAILSDIITSEQGMAVALRFNVRFPAMVFADKGKYAVLHDALQQVMKTELFREKGPDGKAGAVLSPDRWDTAHEVALVDAMLLVAKRCGDVASSAGQARFWPFRGQVAKGKKGALTPYKEHTWFPLVEEMIATKVVAKGKASEATEVKMRVPEKELQPSERRDSLKFPP